MRSYFFFFLPSVYETSCIISTYGIHIGYSFYIYILDRDEKRQRENLADILGGQKEKTKFLL